VCESFLLIWLFLKDTNLCDWWFVSMIYFLLGFLYVFFLHKGFYFPQKLVKKNGDLSLPLHIYYWMKSEGSKVVKISIRYLIELSYFSISLQLENLEYTKVGESCDLSTTLNTIYRVTRAFWEYFKLDQEQIYKGKLISNFYLKP
jgi:hypothetical protein